MRAALLIASAHKSYSIKVGPVRKQMRAALLIPFFPSQALSNHRAPSLTNQPANGAGLGLGLALRPGVVVIMMVLWTNLLVMEVFGEERLRLCGRVRQTGPDGMDGGSHRGGTDCDDSHYQQPPHYATERSPLPLSRVSSRLERAGQGGRVRLRSSPRHYDAAAAPPRRNRIS